MKFAEILRRMGMLPLVIRLNGIVRRLSHVTHRLQFQMEWQVPPPPEW